jgi:hypothetical protein
MRVLKVKTPDKTELRAPMVVHACNVTQELKQEDREFKGSRTKLARLYLKNKVQTKELGALLKW